MTKRSLSRDGATRAERARARVAAVWERYRDVIVGQIELVGRAADMSARGDLDEDLRLTALREAHKLAGSLGTFGFREGSRLARELEKMFRAEVALGEDEIAGMVGAVEKLRREVERGPASPPPRR